MSKQGEEQTTQWAGAIEKAESEEQTPEWYGELTRLSEEWRSCAVGQSLADIGIRNHQTHVCLLYTSPSPRD